MKGIIAKAWADRRNTQLSLTAMSRRITQHLTQRALRPPKARTNYLPILIGEPGIGKSKTLSCIAETLGWNFARWDVNAQGFEDNAGLPYLAEGANGEKIAKTAPSEYLPTFASEPTLLEIGELPTAPPNVQNQIREIIDGLFIGKTVSPFCLMVATGNPPEARFTTGNQIDEAIEDRLDPYIVVPLPDELLTIWSRIMFPTIYRFLSDYPTFISSVITDGAAVGHQDLSPRHWMMIAEKVENLRNVGEPAAVIMQDIRSSFVNATNIIPPLQQYLLVGDNPELMIILGRELITASPELLVEYEKRIQKWLSNNKLRGFVGASKNDLLRVLTQLTKVEVEQLPRFGPNIIKFIELLVDGKCHDMAKNVFDVIYTREHIAEIVLPLVGNTPVLVKMTKMYYELKELAAKVDSK